MAQMRPTLPIQHLSAPQKLRLIHIIGVRPLNHMRSINRLVERRPPGAGVVLGVAVEEGVATDGGDPDAVLFCRLFVAVGGHACLCVGECVWV